MRRRRRQPSYFNPTALLEVIEANGGSVLHAAHELGITRQAVWHHVKKHSLQAVVAQMVRARHKARRDAKPPKLPKPRRPTALGRMAAEGQSDAEVLRILLERNQGAVVDVAREVGLDRRVIWRYVRRYGLVEYLRELVETRKNEFRI